ncbi:MAG TPA: Tfx family DNA-binding protein [Acidilobales archaeon]|nr:Tfx family DNA-binding protein [Acidilobales archaeon]
METASRNKIGLLTKKQLKVLTLRIKGYTQEQIAKALGISRGDVAIIEKRAWKNIKEAEVTLNIFKLLCTASKVFVDEGTHLVDIPKLVLSKADEAGVKVKANFTRIYDEVRFKASGCVKGTKVIKPIVILILRNGDIDVMPKEMFNKYINILEESYGGS